MESLCKNSGLIVYALFRPITGHRFRFKGLEHMSALNKQTEKLIKLNKKLK